MKWKREYSVGIDEIDDQHRVFADLVTSVEQSVIGRERWLAVHSALIRATEFARMHFSVEESLMRIHAYPALEEHAHTHRQFCEHLEQLQHRSLTADVSEEMITYIRGWLEMHVPTMDRQYAVHFLSRGAPTAPMHSLPPAPD